MSTAWIVAFAILASLVAVLTIAVLGVIRRCLPILLEAEAALTAAASSGFTAGLAPGTVVPDFTVEQDGGVGLTASDLRGRRSILLFTGHTCPACRILMDEMRSTRRLELPCDVIAVIEGGRQDPDFGVSTWFKAIYAEPGELSAAFRTNATPHAFAIDEQGVVVGVAVPNTLAQLVELSRRAWKGGERLRLRESRRVVRSLLN